MSYLLSISQLTEQRAQKEKAEKAREGMKKTAGPAVFLKSTDTKFRRDLDEKQRKKESDPRWQLRQQIGEMRLEGITAAKVAEKLGITVYAVNQHNSHYRREHKLATIRKSL